MIKSLRNIESAWKLSRVLVFAFLLFAASVVIYTLYATNESLKKMQATVYILDQGSVLKAQAQNIMENRPVEAKAHIEKFHEYFFTLSPDDKAIESTVSKALYLSDESAKKEYKNLKENGFYNEVISGNVSQNILIDSVSLNFNTYPYLAVCYGKIEVIRTSSVTLRKLVSQCALRDVVRSDNNPHGFLIENWQVIDNTDIKTIPR